MRTSPYNYTLLSVALIEMLKCVSKEITRFCKTCYFRDQSELTHELVPHLHIQLP
jgi:hypothetical protein